jgi:hypothetical protein
MNPTKELNQRSFRQDKEKVRAFAQEHGFSSFVLDPYAMLEDIPRGNNGYHIAYLFTDGDELTFYIVGYDDFQESGLHKSIWETSLDLWDTDTDILEQLQEWMKSQGFF